MNLTTSNLHMASFHAPEIACAARAAAELSFYDAKPRYEALCDEAINALRKTANDLGFKIVEKEALHETDTAQNVIPPSAGADLSKAVPATEVQS